MIGGNSIQYFRLYRHILRAHRALPREMRLLGDDYVKAGTPSSFEKFDCFAQILCLNSMLSEFRRHREVTNPIHIIGFLSQWKYYLDELPDNSNTNNFRGKKLDPSLLEKVRLEQRKSLLVLECLRQMSAEQLGQLYELMHATRDVWKNPQNVS